MKKSPARFSRLVPVLVCLAALTIALRDSPMRAQDGAFKQPDPFAPAGGSDTTPGEPVILPPGVHNTPVPATPAPVSTPAPASTPAASPSPAASPAVVTPAPTGNTVVNANQRVQASKRGVCENHLSTEDFIALAKGVSWYYNWASSTGDTPPGNAPMEFIPMAWGRGGDAGGVAGYLGGHHPRAVLAINEPNLRGQAFMTPDATAAMFKQVKQAADIYKIPVIGPNMALGSGANDSIKARDPITGQQTTYTWFGPFVQAFQFYAQKTKTQTGSMGVHSYNGIGDLTFAVNKMYELTGRPVWVTEFAFWNAKSGQDEIQYLTQAVEFLENSPEVAGYAWFKERVDKNPKLSLLKESGKLTPLGQEYVKLPSHNAHVFYRVPGLLDAGKYVAKENMTLRDTTDFDGDFDMVSHGAGWVAYNIQVDAPGAYVLRVRVSGAPGQMDIVGNGRVLGSVHCTQSQWHMVGTSVSLPSGAQTIRIHCDGQIIHSIEFAPKPDLAMK